ncbi:hypothetical protein FE236_00415 [Mariprofundus erugo]|uniref:hypothetical protein n=1 Tax=Mariprofundus erugo TaxID=2528639 RepID=UPI0010FDE5C4|nr:hypothetical protein [Mariprofundus erugo]TLS78257.1 hypothetical protein FE236_00415 [Mariprofundus erugo]
MSYALHYPTIEFHDIDALKRSLLVWDRVFRIVPKGYEPKDIPEVSTAVTDGVVQNLFVDEFEKARAAEQFLNFYESRVNPNSLLSWPAGFSTETFTRINPDKIDAKLLPLFEQLACSLTREGFMKVPSELAGGYMFYLATSVAQKRSLDLTTDSSDYWAVGSYFSNEGNFSDQVYADKADAYLANLAVDDLLPENLESVSIDNILRFREDTAELRHQFQIELKALREEISRCNNNQHAKYIVNDFIKRFESSKKEYRKSLGFFRKSDLCSIFSVGIPVSAAFFSLPTLTPGADPYTSLRISIGVLFGAVSALAHREGINKQKTVASYLVDAERLTKTPNWLLHRKFEEFIND